MDSDVDVIDAFSHELLKLAQHREFFKRIDPGFLRGQIQGLGHYKPAVADSDLVGKLEKSLEEWLASRKSLSSLQ